MQSEELYAISSKDSNSMENPEHVRGIWPQPAVAGILTLQTLDTLLKCASLLMYNVFAKLTSHSYR